MTTTPKPTLKCDWEPVNSELSICKVCGRDWLEFLSPEPECFGPKKPTLDERKFREFYLYSDDKKPFLHVGIHPDTGGLRVIEYAAIAEMQKELKKVQADKMSNDSDYLKMSSRYQKKIEDLQAEIELIHSRYKTGRHLLQIEMLEAENKKLRSALERIAKDLGTDHCDGNTMIALKALEAK